MWQRTGEWILRYRYALVVLFIVLTGYLGYQASKVQMSYEFAKAIPTDHPQYQYYLQFKQTFGEDGNLLTIGFIAEDFFSVSTFNRIGAFEEQLRKVEGVDDIISVHRSVHLKKNDSTGQLQAVKIFTEGLSNQTILDSLSGVFRNLPFYRGLLYNPNANAYLIGLRINKNVLASKQREQTVGAVERLANAFAKESKMNLRMSGLPLIRTNVAMRIARELNWFLAGSLLLSALILFIFFRSVGTMLLSLGVVILGVVYSLATIHLLGYKITLLTALIPPLVVVIGIPNCIYFLNKFHTAFVKTGDKRGSIVEMVSKMGVVTLFCNISAALGFAVFALTKSMILKEFGMVAGINIMGLFFISLVLIPIVLLYLPAPETKHTRYLENPWLLNVLGKIEKWVFGHRKTIYVATVVCLVVSIMGIVRLQTRSFIVDDLPTNDKIIADLRFFEQHFGGVLPLEILVDTRKKNGIAGSRALNVFEKVSAFSDSLKKYPELAKPLSLAEGLKFARQGFYDGDSNNYSIPNAFDGAFLADYLKPGKNKQSSNGSFEGLMASFIDSNRQTTRISVNMADIGSTKMPELIAQLKNDAINVFDTSKTSITLTGSSITFLEGNRFIISGLKESILWAFLFIALCMLYLFRSFQILICSLIPNLIPLVMTAGLMGWAGVAIKPSTVLVFSVALGIAIDITIRFLVNYKQELPKNKGEIMPTVALTIRDTGISIVYTSLVLIAGFIIFVASGFGSTQALGWLTSFTLLTATITNLVLLPVLLLLFKRS